MWGSIGEGLVPIFEEHSARIERNKSIHEWMTLEPMERALIIAIRRIDMATRNIQSDAETKEIKRKSGKRK